LGPAAFARYASAGRLEDQRGDRPAPGALAAEADAPRRRGAWDLKMRSGPKPEANRRSGMAITLAEDDSSGPLGAMAIVAATCVVLAAIQTAFWLVVPLILALVLYYLLRPGHLWLTRMGLPGGGAAGVVVACFTVVAVGLLFEAAPRLRALA